VIKSRAAKGKARVTFTVDPQVGGLAAAVCGEWNGWSADAGVMHSDAEGGSGWRSSWKHRDSLPLLLASPRTAAAAPQAGPDDLAGELNPHKTELNPHKAVPAASRARADQKRRLSARGA